MSDERWALEAIAKALLELAAAERESDEIPAREILVDRRNCATEVGLSPSAFVHAAGRDFAAFRISRRLTATKADVLSWLKSREVAWKVPRSRATVPVGADPDGGINAVHAAFISRVGRPMTDDELDLADMWMAAGRSISAHMAGERCDTPDDVAAHVQGKIGTEPGRHSDWRSLGLDPADLERRAEVLRAQLRAEHPEMTWRDRTRAVWDMWSATTEPLYEVRRAQRAAGRAAKKAEKIRSGQLGLKR